MGRLPHDALLIDVQGMQLLEPLQKGTAQKFYCQALSDRVLLPDPHRGLPATDDQLTNPSNIFKCCLCRKNNHPCSRPLGSRFWAFEMYVVRRSPTWKLKRGSDQNIPKQFPQVDAVYGTDLQIKIFLAIHHVSDLSRIPCGCGLIQQSRHLPSREFETYGVSGSDPSMDSFEVCFCTVSWSPLRIRGNIEFRPDSCHGFLN
eukprot:1215828-Rhodomonas_salina.2